MTEKEFGAYSEFLLSILAGAHENCGKVSDVIQVTYVGDDGVVFKKEIRKDK